MSKNRIHNIGPFQHEEAKANSALIYPGYLLQLDSNGEVLPHDTEGGVAEALFAAEDALQGRTVDIIYADDSIVTYHLPGKGSVVNAMIESGEDISIGDALMSAGNGKLKEVHPDSALANDYYVVGFAVEEVDCGGSTPADALCAVRVI